MHKGFYFILLLFTVNSGLAQVFNMPGIPLIKNFTEEDVNHKLTVYDMSQSINGVMYFATSGALLEFDGIRWNSYTSGKESDLRAVYYKDDEHIYTSGHGGFGYWSKNEKGGLEYTSLFFKEPLKHAPLLPVFSRITEIDGNILFQTFQQIFIYDPINDKLDSTSAYKGFNLMFSSKGRAFIQDSGIGLFEIKGNDRILIEGTEKQNLHITGVSINKANELIIVTKENGVWKLKDKIFSKTDWDVNENLQEFLTNDIKELDNDNLIIGTIRNGIYIVSSEGNILLHLEKNNGLLDNTIRRVFADLNSNVWLGLEKGLSYIQVNCNTNYLIDNEGKFGTVYTSYLKDSLLYLGTNQGLFVKNISNLKSVPELIERGIGQIWEIEEVNNELLVGAHQGVFRIDSRNLKEVHLEGGAWIFRKHPKINDIMYVGFYSGIAVFKKIEDNWIFQKKWDGYGESSRFIEFDKYGHIWVAHPTKGYYRLRLSDDGMDLKEYEFYGITNKFVDTYSYICKIDDDLVFYNPKGFFNYDPIENSFIESKYPSELFKGIKSINSISQYKNIFWYSSQKSLGYIFRNGNDFTNYTEPFYSIRNKHLEDFNKFEMFNDSIFGISIDNGMIFHKINNKRKVKHNSPPIIRYIKLISTTDTIIAPINQKEILEIPNSNNFVKIGIALSKLPVANSLKVKYKLSGLENEWSDWNYMSELNFPGLSSGSYTLELKSGGENEINSENIEFQFKVLRPWYFNNISIAIYALLIILFNLYYRNYFRKKNKKQLSLLRLEEEEKRKRQEEKFERDRLEAERKMLLLREENLGLEIKKKNSELASSTLNNIKKNELLIDLIEDIDKIDKEVLNSSLHSPIKKVIKKINNHLVDKDDWLTFELNFRNAHTDFFKKLREKHPDLSSNEIKLSAYLKLNLSSKEISSLMHISIRSVEQSRYRLRKKLNLLKDSNLVNYIQTF
jgi:AraC family chitin signaling transcriptional activator